MPLVALTPVLNDLLQKDGANNSSFPQQQQQVPLSNATTNEGSSTTIASTSTEYLQQHTTSTTTNQLALLSTSNENNPRQQPRPRSVTRFSKGLKREDSFLQKFSNRYSYRGLGPMDHGFRHTRPNIDKDEPIKFRYSFIQRIVRSCNYFVISTDESFLFYWLIILNIFVLYNLWFSIARHAFDPLQRDYSQIWQILDYVADAMYFTDIVVQFRTGYLEQGLLVYDHRKLATNYMRSSRFVFDVLSLTPLDLLQLKFGSIPILRFPRFFKVYRTFQLYYLQESRTVYPNTYRVINLFHILLLLGHWLASFYFMVSKAEGFVGYWSYPKPVGNFSQLAKMYLRCLYWSTLTLTTIGDLPPPETNWQWLKNFTNKRAIFAITSYMIGIFVFSSIIGQVGNVITNRNASRLEFERLLDSAKQYMRSHNVPPEMQRRVQRWYDYSWSRGRMSGAGDVHSIKLLPDKLKTELALHVNLGTLKKVSIFQECQPEFLHDLVLKMRAYIFTPGDIICRKGEIAREMFIIADGVLEVVNDKNDVLTRLVAGDFFGEIGILNIDGANRRTADVRSVGYSELFSLSKEDVLEGCRDYPEAERKLYEYAQNRLGLEKAKKEAAEKMKGAFSTLASIASCLTQNPVTISTTTTNVTSNSALSPIQETNEKEIEPKILIQDETQPNFINEQSRSKSQTSLRQSPTIHLNDNEKPLIHRTTSEHDLHFPPSPRFRTRNLITEIEQLVNDRLLSIEETYKEQISVLKEQNERKDARIKLLEQKIQRLQRILVNRNRNLFEEQE